MVDVPLNSRYLNTSAIKHNGKETLGLWSGEDWLESTPTSTIVATASQAGRADLIAAQYLGSVDFWWAILYYNNKTDINWPRAGDEVQIPSAAYVLGT